MREIFNQETDRVFGESNTNWNPLPEYNISFLRQTYNYFRNMVGHQQYVFLNDIYQQLDMPRTTTGAVCGVWVDKGELIPEFMNFWVNENTGFILITFSHIRQIHRFLDNPDLARNPDFSVEAFERRTRLFTAIED